MGPIFVETKISKMRLSSFLLPCLVQSYSVGTIRGNRPSAWQDDSSTMIGTEKGGPNFVPSEVLLAKRSHWKKNEHLDHGLSDALGMDNGVRPTGQSNMLQLLPLRFHYFF